MSGRLVVLVPLVCLAALAAALALSPDRQLVVSISSPAVKLLAIAGAVVAAAAFDGGDYLRRAWGCYAISYLLLLLPDVIWGPHSPSMAVESSGVGVARAALVIGANLASVIGTVLFGFAWRVSGLELPGSRTWRTILVAIVIAVAAAIVVPPLIGDVRDAMAGSRRGIISVASDAGDAISFCLIAPVLLTALALRGGKLAWPWAVLFVSLFGWLLFDAAGTVGAWAHASASSVRMAEEFARCLACTCNFSAGLLQRRAVR